MTSKLTRTLTAAMFAAALALAGCGGGPASEADAIAQDACDLIAELQGLDEQVMDGDMDAMDELDDAFMRIAELEQRANDAGISDDEMIEAMERNCPELANEF